MADADCRDCVRANRHTHQKRTGGGVFGLPHRKLAVGVNDSVSTLWYRKVQHMKCKTIDALRHAGGGGRRARSARSRWMLSCRAWRQIRLANVVTLFAPTRLTSILLRHRGTRAAISSLLMGSVGVCSRCSGGLLSLIVMGIPLKADSRFWAYRSA